jgi:hypothetical protein
VTNDNHSVVDGLSAIPSNKYGFAPDVLCVAEGCEVRLVKNINVSAGLVNSAMGYVVKVLYNNADVPAVVEGRNPPPHCLIVDFPSFQGFISSERSERIHPIPEHPNWVPIFKLKFYPSSVPTWIRKKQSTSQWYREQFPLDLSRHITAHRAQGQTLANRTVTVDLKLNNPDSSLPDRCIFDSLRRLHEGSQSEGSVRGTDLPCALGEDGKIRKRPAAKTRGNKIEKGDQ